MAESQQQQGIPTRLSCEQFRQFVLPHLTVGRRGPAPKLTLLAIFNYILRLLYLGCPWKELPIEKDQEGHPEIHYSRIYSAFRKWQADGCFDAVFAGSVLKLHEANLLDATVIHGDGTTTSAKKGGDNIGFSGHKKVKGDKIVAFCDRNCNVIAPFVSAPGNRNELPLLREALPLVSRLALAVGLDLQGTIVSLDGVYDCRRNRKAIFNRGMVPNINANPRGRRSSKRFWCERQKPGIFAETRLLRKRTGMLSIADLFKGRHFDREIIILCVRWYLRFKLSFRDLVEMMAERGVSLAHTTIMRWISRYVPEFEKRWNRFACRADASWRVDETYVKIKGRWTYLYRAVDKEGKTVDFVLRAKRDVAAAKAFFRRAFKSQGRLPRAITLDGYQASHRAAREVLGEHPRGKRTLMFTKDFPRRPMRSLIAVERDLLW